MILVVGDVMTDVIVRPEGALAPGTDRRATIVRAPGGSGANIACWLGALGVATRFAGRVGAADRADHADALRRHGVQAHLAVDERAETGAVVALLSPDGERSFFTDRGANLNLAASDLPPSLLEGVRGLHISGHVFFTDGPRAAARALMETAAERGVEVSVDAGSAGWLSQPDARSFRDWTRGARLCFANCAEAALLSGGYELFVVTRGAAGAEARVGGERVKVPAHTVEALDTTGAGDAFTAGFLAARRVGRTLRECLMDATTVAARCVTQAGGRPTAV